MQARDLRGPEGPRLAKRMDPRAPEGLDRIDVADAGDRTLIEQQDLDRRPRPAAEKRAQPRHRETTRERLLSKRCVQRHLWTATLAVAFERRRIDDRHPTELSRIGEPHRGPIDETDLAAHVPLVHIGRSV